MLQCWLIQRSCQADEPSRALFEGPAFFVAGIVAAHATVTPAARRAAPRRRDTGGVAGRRGGWPSTTGVPVDPSDRTAVGFALTGIVAGFTASWFG